MNVSQLSSALRDRVQNGELVLDSALLQNLEDQAIAAIPVNALLALLESKGLTFQNVAIDASEDGVSVVGDVSLHATAIRLEADFKLVDDAYQLNLSAKSLQTYRIPGGLELQNAQIALQASAKTVTGSIGGSILIGDSEVSTVLLVGKVEDELLFQWTIDEIHLSEIAKTFLGDASMPPELPDLAFKDVETVIKPKSGTFSFKAASAAPINFPANRDGLSITELEIALERTVTEGISQINCNLHLVGDKPLSIANELTLEKVQLDLELAGKDWKVSGNVVANVFDHELTLEVVYEQTEAERHFKLSTTVDPAIDIVNVEQAGQMSVSAFELEMSKARTEGAEANWSVSSDGSLVIADVLNTKGNLTLAKQDDEVSLVFKPEQATVHIPLPPDQTAAMDLEFGEISIVRKRNEGTARSTFAFEAAVDLAFQGFNATVHQFLPEKIATTFKANAQGVTLTVDRVLQPFDFALPEIDISDSTKVELGVASIDVSDLLVRLGKQIEVGAELGIGLPSKLNNLFGVNDDGTPKIKFFNTFDPNDRDNTVVKAKLNIGTAGLSITPTSSIIRAIRVVEENGESFWYCTLGENGEFGEVKFRVPKFTYDPATSSFQASGGFETVKPLALPLTFAKSLLSACKLKGAADALPDSLALEGVKIVDDHGEFRVEELIKVMGEIGANLPDSIKEELKVIGDHLDRLPDDFKQYLNIEIPQSFNFDIAVTPTGTVRFDARVKEGDPPIKLITPGLFGVLPVLNCISLRGISFGELAGGSLFLLQVDATIDQFDLVTLAASLGIPDNKVLPPTRTLHRRLTLDKLFMVIVYQTVIPIPIPLFYDEVGIDYLGLEGLQLAAHAAFPMPSFDLTEVGKVLAEFKRFFTERDFLFQADNRPKNVNLKFAIENTFVQLPQYLGGKSLGSATDRASIDIFQVMNGLKTLSVNSLVQAIPLSARVGNEAVAFGPVSLNAGWMITTPEEFRQMARQGSLDPAIAPLGLLNPAQAGDLLKVLPAPNAQASDEQGLAVFLRGGWAIENGARFQTAFALAGDAHRFSTGFRLDGSIANLVDLQLAGQIAVGKTTPPVQLDGSARLAILGRSILDGSMRLDTDKFQVNGNLALFPPSSPLQVNGQMAGSISQQTFNFQGSVSTKLAGVNLIGAQAILNNQGFLVSGSWLGTTTTLSLLKTSNNTLAFRGNTTINLNLDRVFFGATSILRAGRLNKVADSWSIPSLGVTAALDVTVSEAGFSAQMTATARWNNQSFSLAPVTLTIAPKDIGDFATQIRQALVNDANLVSSLFLSQFASADAWLQGIKSGAINLANNAYRDLGTGLSTIYGLGQQQAAQALKNANFVVSEVAQVLNQGYGLAAQETAQILKSVNYSVNEIGSTLKTVFNQSTNDAARLLKNLGYSITDIAGVLRNVFGQGADAAASVLKSAGYGVIEIGNVLRTVFNQGANAVAQTLKNLGYSIFDIANVLKTVFNQGANAVAQTLRNLGYGVSEIASTLKNIFGLTARDTAIVLKALGYGMSDIANTLKNTFGSTARDAADIFKSLGYGVSDIARTLKDTFRLGAGDVADILKKIGYGFKDIVSALRSVFSLGVKELRAILKSLGASIKDLWDLL